MIYQWNALLLNLINLLFIVEFVCTFYIVDCTVHNASSIKHQ